MILDYEISTNFSVNTLMDLKKLQPLEHNSNLKINTSELGRKLGVDRRTVRKYIEGYQKPNRRKKKSQFDEYHPLIRQLLSNETKVFHYKSILWRYLKDNYGLTAPESSFRRYISSIEEFNGYFQKHNAKRVKSPTPMRYETEPGQQAQIDWKESMSILLNTGEIVCINIFAFFMSYSRFRIYRLSLQKTQDILFNFLNDAFESVGGVPDELVCDNMKTIMKEARTEYQPGKVAVKFQQFADDYGFKVKPCIAGRPATKGKVESPMRILEELYAYNGDFTYSELVKKLHEINERENSRFHDSYQTIPILSLEKEKDALHPLPIDKIRRQYKIQTQRVKVNKSSMITYQKRQYSVPPEYIGKHLLLQCYDNQLHIQYNMKLITVHTLSQKPLNYHESHYIELAKKTLPFDDEAIETIAKQNLKRIGERYD